MYYKISNYCKIIVTPKTVVYSLPLTRVRVSGGDLCEAEAPTEAAAEKRVSSGDLCEAEAPTEAAAETGAEERGGGVVSLCGILDGRY